MLHTPHKVRDIPILLDIVSVDVLALLGLEALDTHGPIVDNVANRLRSRIILNEATDEYVDS